MSKSKYRLIDRPRRISRHFPAFILEKWAKRVRRVSSCLRRLCFPCSRNSATRLPPATQTPEIPLAEFCFRLRSIIFKCFHGEKLFISPVDEWYPLVCVPRIFPCLRYEVRGIRGAALRTVSEFCVVPRQTSSYREFLKRGLKCFSFNNHHLFQTIISLTLVFIYKNHQFDMV